MGFIENTARIRPRRVLRAARKRGRRVSAGGRRRICAFERRSGESGDDDVAVKHLFITSSSDPFITSSSAKDSSVQFSLFTLNR